MISDSRRYPRELLEAFASLALEKAGLGGDYARIVGEALVEADARGLPSHGILRLLPVYVDRLQRGAMNPHPQVSVITASGATTHLDGDGGPGQIVAAAGMRVAIETATTFGIGVCSVRNSSHYGIGSRYVSQATHQGLIGIALTNAPSNMPPAGGRSKFFGTNPITIGVPYDETFSLILDMSTSMVARGKIVIADQNGSSLPEGWAIDEAGSPTTDPAQALAGAVLPLGGYKGAGLALMIDIFCGILGGASYGPHIVDLYDQGRRYQDVGHFLMAIDIESFIPAASFRDQLRGFVEEIRSQPRMPGVERIFMPGEIEYEAERESNSRGIELSDSGAKLLADLAVKLGIPPLSTDEVSQS